MSLDIYILYILLVHIHIYISIIYIYILYIYILYIPKLYNIITHNDPSAGSPTDALLRLLFPLDHTVRLSFHRCI